MLLEKYGLICSIKFIKIELGGCATGFMATPSVMHIAETEGRISICQLSSKLYKHVFSLTEKSQILKNAATF